MRALVVALLAVLPLASCIDEAHASPPVLPVVEATPAAPPVISIAQAAPADVIISEAENLDVSCLASGTTITWTSSKAQGYLTCWVDGTTPVAFGAAGVVAGTNGIPVCEDTACADGGRGIWKSPLTKKSVFGCDTTAGTVHAICTVTFP